MENIGFKRVVFGYNPKQVDEAVDCLIADVEEKDAQIARYGEKFEKLNEQLEALEKRQTAERALIADMMISARQDAAMMLDIAREEADMIAAEAKQSAEGIVTDAQQESERITTGAENEADAVRRRVHEGYAQTEMDIRDMIESARYAKEQLQLMFEASEDRVAQMLEAVRKMLPEAGDTAKLLTEGEQDGIDICATKY